MGWSFGGLLALRASRTTIRMANGTLTCETLRISPHLWRLLLAQIQLGVSCELSTKQGSILQTRLRASPFWAPSSLSAKIQMTQVDLAEFGSFLRQKFAGRLTGYLEIDHFKLPSRELGSAQWKVLGTGLETPALQSNFFNLPPIRLGALDSEGSWAGQQLKVKNLKVGDESGSLWGEFQVDLKLDRSMNPQSGFVQGRLKTDPEFEKSELRDLDLSDLFGSVGSNGYRSFKKEASGNWLFLLQKPQPSP
jgi:hypothetical protein